MGRSIFAVFLILDVLVCPFACSGSIPLGSDCSTEPCCASRQSDPVDEPLRPADDGCDGSCKNCLCGGAINGDDACPDLMSSDDAVAQDWLPDRSVNAGTSAGDSLQIDCDDTTVHPAGVALRAILQSYLL
jgi:hypothetical protein